MKKRPLKKAIKIAGSKEALARLIEVHPTLVGKWLKDPPKNDIHIRHVQAIERVTGGAVTKHDLLPDIFGAAE